ncbi:MAG TPA: aminotransferase class I/II-fold pyridoxal phosphate-dependent enzyme, partial [Nitrosopumilaceae archaeon]|nr:aminotransferase class I/II-fold pyridoxal phosphate-dependent enzyme [Nitrosopumilaceae archaeon]
DLKNQFKKILATEYTAVSTPIQHAAIAGFEISSEMDEYFKSTRKIHQIMGEYTFNALNEIEGVKATKPEATFYLLADFNNFLESLEIKKINTSQRFAESLIQHPYHTAIVGGDSLVLERTNFSARLAFVDYDGSSTLENFRNNPPKTSSDRIEFAKVNAPRVASGIQMIEKFLVHIRKSSDMEIQNKQSSLATS